MRKILIFLFINVSLFALNIDSTRLDLQLVMGQRAKKSFTIVNNKDYPLRYSSYIEKNGENIKVSPNFFILPAHSKKVIEITVFGEKRGEYRYFWILEEEKLDLNSKGNSVKLNMKYRIEQKYVVK